MLKWYRSVEGDKEAVIELEKFIKYFVKGLKSEEVSGGCCVTSNTPSKEAPYIDYAAENLIIAAGGCGYAAQSSDEIGRIAAMLAIEGKWDSCIKRESCKARWQQVIALTET